MVSEKLLALNFYLAFQGRDQVLDIWRNEYVLHTLKNGE